jgi:transcriptional regulator with XRE-family HTH domain
MRTQSALERTKPTLRDLRVKRGLSLREAARRAGIDPAHLSRVERGKSQLSVDALGRLAPVLGLRGLTRQLAPFREAS